MTNSEKRKLKICHIITRMDRGGSPDVVRILIEQLDPARFESTLIYGPTLHPSQKTKELINSLGPRSFLVKTLRRDINLFYDVAALIKLFRIIRRAKFDIVHTHTAKAGFVGRIAARLSGVPCVVYSSHGHDFYGYFGYLTSALIVFAEKFAAFFCDRIHVLTELERKEFLDFNICRAGKLEVISSGVESAFLKVSQADSERVRQELSGRQEHPLFVAIVGRLEPIKGPGVFIEAIALVARHNLTARFLVVGDGSLRGELEKRVEELGLSDRVIFTGWREDVPAILPILHILVLPSLNEGVGRSALEAQAIGVPVVASKVGGIPEGIRDTETGILVEPENPALLADAILKLLNDEASRNTMAQNARAWIDQKFSDRTMVARFQHLYEQLLSERAQ